MQDKKGGFYSKFVKNKYFLILLGLVLGIILATILAGKSTGQPGIIPSLIFDLGICTLHLHHWLLAFIGIVVLGIVGWKVIDLEKYSLFYLVLGILAGLMLQGILKYEDWYLVIYKS